MISNTILLRIAEANMKQLFATSQTKLSVQEIGDDPGFRLLTITLDFKKKNQSEVKIEIRDNRVIGIQLNASSINDITLDLLRTASAIQKKIEEFRRVKTIYYYNDSYLISNFKEIGIDYKDGRRDLLINNARIYSIIKWVNKRPIAKPLTEKELIEKITEVASTPDCELDVCDATLHTFVDYEEYEWGEEE